MYICRKPIYTERECPYEIAEPPWAESMCQTILYGEEMRPTERMKLEKAKQLPRAQRAVLNGGRQNVSTAHTSEKAQKRHSQSMWNLPPPALRHHPEALTRGPTACAASTGHGYERPSCACVVALGLRTLLRSSGKGICAVYHRYCNGGGRE